MTEAKCIEKIKGTHREIKAYKLIDVDKHEILITAAKLKQCMGNGSINVSNLKLTKDNRIVSSLNSKAIKSRVDALSRAIDLNFSINEGREFISELAARISTDTFRNLVNISEFLKEYYKDSPSKTKIQIFNISGRLYSFKLHSSKEYNTVLNNLDILTTDGVINLDIVDEGYIINKINERLMIKVGYTKLIEEGVHSRVIQLNELKDIIIKIEKIGATKIESSKEMKQFIKKADLTEISNNWEKEVDRRLKIIESNTKFIGTKHEIQKINLRDTVKLISRPTMKSLEQLIEICNKLFKNNWKLKLHTYSIVPLGAQVEKIIWLNNNICDAILEVENKNVSRKTKIRFYFSIKADSYILYKIDSNNKEISNTDFSNIVDKPIKLKQLHNTLLSIYSRAI